MILDFAFKTKKKEKIKTNPNTKFLPIFNGRDKYLEKKETDYKHQDEKNEAELRKTCDAENSLQCKIMNSKTD